SGESERDELRHDKNTNTPKADFTGREKVEAGIQHAKPNEHRYADGEDDDVLNHRKRPHFLLRRQASDGRQATNGNTNSPTGTTISGITPSSTSDPHTKTTRVQ